MKAVYDPAQAAHDPQTFLVKGVFQPSSERPARAERLLAGLAAAGIEVLPAGAFGPGPLAAVHTPDYLRFLRTAHAEWRALPGASAEVVANVHPVRHRGGYPDSVVGRAGWHMADAACPIGEHTYAAACASANSALTAARQVLDGAPSAYALCRPPGHHAYADMAGGFCFLNNVAIAAQFIREARYASRVAILDIDVHHGNGTQGIFYRRRDVLTVSVHADPRAFYPFFWGHAEERGEGEGEGFNRNLPLPLLSGDDVYLAALARAGETIAAFAPQALVVALGLDASEADPLRGLSVTTDGFARAGRLIGELAYPTVYVQEGGYLSALLGDNLAAFLGSVGV